MFNSVSEQSTSLHHLVASVVHRRGGVIDAAHKRELIRVFCHLWEDLADLDPVNGGLDWLERPADFCGRFGLHVPGVELTGPADKEQHDAVHVGVFGIGCGFRAAELGERQTQRSNRSSMQEIAPSKAITESGGALSIQPDHSTAPGKM